MSFLTIRVCLACSQWVYRTERDGECHVSVQGYLWFQVQGAPAGLSARGRVDHVHGSEPNGELRHADIRENVFIKYTSAENRLPF